MALLKNKTYQENKKLNSLSIKKNSQVSFVKSKKHNYMNGGVYFFKKILKYIKNKKVVLKMIFLQA